MSAEGESLGRRQLDRGLERRGDTKASIATERSVPVIAKRPSA